MEILCKPPFDLDLCVRVAEGFADGNIARERLEGAAPHSLRLGVWLDGRPALVEVSQETAGSDVVTARSEPAAEPEVLRRLVQRVVNAQMDLGPFYSAVRTHPVLGPLAAKFRGLKPLRPASLFDMLVMAVTEQQISLAAARKIQSRLIERFGTKAQGLPVFPRAQEIADAPLEALTGCGLSGRKAEYLKGMAQEVVAGTLDLAALEAAPADGVRARIAALRGFGRWSADYILVRGLADVDAVPYDDLAVRRVMGQMLADGHLLTPAEAEELLAPLAPCRGLAVFYLLVGSRARRP
jgi:DNA-3-methyladenine glycosylase II